MASLEPNARRSLEPMARSGVGSGLGAASRQEYAENDYI